MNIYVSLLREIPQKKNAITWKILRRVTAHHTTEGKLWRGINYETICYRKK